jgi:ribosomal protein S18 acetylase RimI-like enzyme
MTFEPPCPSESIPGPFIQTIRSEHAVLVWSSTDIAGGVAHVLSVEVDPKHRRRGHGTAIAKAMQSQAALLFKAHGVRFRRVVMMTNQKTHIHARAWLTKLGYHHIQTLTNVAKGEDVLVYLLGMD